ncbi:MAG: hypothetical protein ACI3V1_06420 [Faecousia sp.]
MATTESSVLLSRVDSSGSFNLIYPITTAENVIGSRLYYTVNIPASGWVGNGPYTQEIPIIGILSKDCPHYGLVICDDAYAEFEAFGYIDVLETTDGKINLTCLYDCPDIDLTIQLEVNR